MNVAYSINSMHSYENFKDSSSRSHCVFNAQYFFRCDLGIMIIDFSFQSSTFYEQQLGMVWIYCNFPRNIKTRLINGHHFHEILFLLSICNLLRFIGNNFSIFWSLHSIGYYIQIYCLLGKNNYVSINTIVRFQWINKEPFWLYRFLEDVKY